MRIADLVAHQKMPVPRESIAALLLAIGLVCAAPIAARSAGRLPTGEAVGDQDISPFYRWAGRLPAKPGRLLREEPLPANLTPRQAASAKRILYTSTDVRWNSGIIPTSGMLYLPHGKAPAGGWPLVVWSHGTVGVADSCAPSWTGPNPRDRNYVARWLDEGFAVVAPDYQGLGGPGPHTYVIWQAEGRSVLDAARAALSARQGIANRVIITGQSQGSGASLGAAQLAASYAPDLNVRGAIATALLATFSDQTAPERQQTSGGPAHYTLYRMLGGSLPPGSPPVESLLTDKGKLLLQAARTGCDLRTVAAKNGITADNAFAVPSERIDTLLGTVGRMEPFRTKFPLMLGVGLSDELIAPSQQQTAVEVICRAGNRVRYRGYAGAHHGETLTRSTDDAVAFARAALGNESIASGCPAGPAGADARPKA